MKQYKIADLTYKIIEHHLLFNGLMDYEIEVFLRGFISINPSTEVIIWLRKNELIHYEVSYKIAYAEEKSINELEEFIEIQSTKTALQLIQMIRSD